MLDSTLHNYPLDLGLNEVDRLNKQFGYFQSVCGYGKSVKLPLDPSKVEVILDIAAGTGAWTLEVTRDPIIASRLSSPTDNLRLLACDISLAKMSPELTSDTANPKIKVFQHDITQPFPPEMHGTVDIAHMSLLLWAFTQKGWEQVLKNIFYALKPGGRLVLLEMDLTFYAATSAPFKTINQLQDYTIAARAGSSILDRMNTLFSNQLLFNDRVLGLSYRMPSFLQSASFSTVTTKAHKGPLGRLCITQPGPDGTSVAEYSEFFTNDILYIADILVQEALALNDPRSDLKIVTEEDKKSLFDEFAQFAREHGVYSILTEWIAQKM